MPYKKILKLCSIVLPSLAAIALLILLITVSHTEDISVTGTRSNSGFMEMKEVTETELAREDAPIGVQKTADADCKIRP